MATFAPRAAVVAICGFGLLLSVGCGPTNNTGRYGITGVVTFQGKPLDRGTIEFAAEPGGNAAGGAMIQDGRYSVPESHGLRPGVYRVRLYSSAASSAGPAPQFPGESGPPAKERIPPQYNSKSTLTAKVTEDGPNEFNIEIR